MALIVECYCMFCMQVAAGATANGSAPAAAGNMTVPAATASQLTATGLAPGRFYDVYLVAADTPAGNRQVTVLNFTYVAAGVSHSALASCMHHAFPALLAADSPPMGPS
jgi:hypothetical protein